MRIQLATIVIVLALVFGCATSSPLAGGLGADSSSVSESRPSPGPSTPQPFVSDEPPRLRFGSLLFMGADGNLYVASGGTETIRRITSNSTEGGGDRVYASYGWAGDNVVYAAQRLAGGMSAGMELVVQAPDGVTTTLIDEAGIAPFFLYPSPDGTRVAFLGSTDVSGVLRMGSIGLDGTERVIHGTGQPFYAAWAPSGRSLITHIGLPLGPDGSVLQIQSVGALVRGSSGRELSFSTGVFRAPSPRSDGAGYAVLLKSEISTGIFHVSPSGEILEQVAPIRDSAAFVYSPTGTNLAFIDGEVVPSVGTMVGPLYVATTAASGGDFRPPKLVSDSAIAFFWSPDGSKLLVFKPGVVRGPDGPTVAYEILIYRTVQGDVKRIAVIRPTPRFSGQIVPYFDQYHSAYTVWSPDSSLVALNVLSDDETPTVVLLETSAPVAAEMMVSFGGRTTPVVHDNGGIVLYDGVRARTVAVGTAPFFKPE